MTKQRTWKWTKRGERFVFIMQLLAMLAAAYLLAGVWWDTDHFTWVAPFFGHHSL